MKNISAICLFLSLTAMVNLTSNSVAQNTRYTLYPPGNFHGYSIENAAYLTWEKPQDSLGNTPTGILGYYITRNGFLIHYIGYPDSLSCYEFDLEPGSHPYFITANYDLTSYGFPGMVEESSPVGPVDVELFLDSPWPVFESWNTGGFSPYWRLFPQQGNWIVMPIEGNPAPTAQFNGLPSVNDYSNDFSSSWIPGVYTFCGTIFLEFDFKLNDINAGNTEKFSVQYYADSTWTEAAAFTNGGSTGWIHEKIELTEALGSWFKVAFRASGINSSNISGWMVDNIQIYGECKDPVDFGYTTSGNVISLNWQYPCGTPNSVYGFNIYRTDLSGNPPFTMIGQVDGLSFNDTVYTGITSGVYKYQVKTLFEGANNPGVVGCESPGDDTLSVNIPLNVPALQKNGVSISPNPANDFVNVKSDMPVALCRIYNMTGEMVYSFAPGRKTSFTIPFSGLPAGIYFLKITSSDNVARTLKLIIK